MTMRIERAVGAPGRPTDPKTVIARALKPHLTNGPSVVLATRDVADALSHWLNDIAGDMTPGDPRVDGYTDLADRLPIR